VNRTSHQEDEQVTAHGILAELVLDKGLQTDEPFAHVDRMSIDEDPAPVVQKSHWGRPSKRSTIPPGSSTTRFVVARCTGPLGTAGEISMKPGSGLSAFPICLRHFLKLQIPMPSRWQKSF